MFDDLCREHLMKVPEFKQGTALFPDKLSRESFTVERLFFNNYQLLILFFVRHRTNYPTAESVESFFSFNLVSGQVQEFKQDYLHSQFPDQFKIPQERNI